MLHRFFLWIQRTAVSNPWKDLSLRGLAILLLVWIAGVAALLFSITDTFTQSPFQGKFFFMWMLLGASTASVVRAMRAYIQKKRYSLQSQNL